jgi:hypothetical protein
MVTGSAQAKLGYLEVIMAGSGLNSAHKVIQHIRLCSANNKLPCFDRGLT